MSYVGAGLECCDEAKRLQQVQQMRLAGDDMKVLIQLAKEVKAFQDFRQLQVVSELAVAIGEQGGAWSRQLSRRFVQAAGVLAAPVCFMVDKPKAREIHVAYYSDRVVLSFRYSGRSSHIVLVASSGVKL